MAPISGCRLSREGAPSTSTFPSCSMAPTWCKGFRRGRTNTKSGYAMADFATPIRQRKSSSGITSRFRSQGTPSARSRSCRPRTGTRMTASCSCASVRGTPSRSPWESRASSHGQMPPFVAPPYRLQGLTPGTYTIVVTYPSSGSMPAFSPLEVFPGQVTTHEVDVAFPQAQR